MDEEKIRTACFFIGIICSVTGFLIAKIYSFALLLLVLGIGMVYHEYSYRKQRRLILESLT